MKSFSCTNGDKFGYWIVINNTPISKGGHTNVLVQCKCGKEQLIPLSSLLKGKTKGCPSCRARDRIRQINIGDKYKHWVVIDGPKLNKHGSLVYLVECDCKQSQKWIQSNVLVNPTTNIQCQKCAAIKRGLALSALQGRIGELNQTRFAKLKRSAKKRNLTFDLTINYLWNLFQTQKQLCAITGDFIKNIKNASLDRIDSSVGYIEGNVQWTTVQANRSKHIMTTDEFIKFCTKVLNHANQQPSQS